MSLAENMRRLRTQKELSQKALANAAGVNQQLISQIENGLNTSTKFLPKIAAALNAKVHELDPSFVEETGKASEESDILALLKRIDDLSDEDVFSLMVIVRGYREANIARRGLSLRDGQSGPETHRHESEPSRQRS